MANPVEILYRGNDMLGECPLWDDRAQALYWVDVRAPALQRYELAGGKTASWRLPVPIGSFAFRRTGGFLLALQTGLFRSAGFAGSLEPFANPEPDRPTNRLNDGRTDPMGRFWVGSMSDASRDPLGSLYRIDPDGGCSFHGNEIVVPNSLAWSPDGRIMYFADTYRQTIWQYAYDPADGMPGNRRTFRDMHSHPGRPDGSAVDAEGGLWNCEYGGWRIVRYRPDGEIDRVIPMPVANPTCCCFGDSDFRTLFVTSARQRLTPEELSAQPAAGSVFAIRTAVAGLPEYRFAG